MSISSAPYRYYAIPPRLVTVARHRFPARDTTRRWGDKLAQFTNHHPKAEEILCAPPGSGRGPMGLGPCRALVVEQVGIHLPVAVGYRYYSRRGGADATGN